MSYLKAPHSNSKSFLQANYEGAVFIQLGVRDHQATKLPPTRISLCSKSLKADLSLLRFINPCFGDLRPVSEGPVGCVVSD